MIGFTVIVTLLVIRVIVPVILLFILGELARRMERTPWTHA